MGFRINFLIKKIVLSLPSRLLNRLNYPPLFLACRESDIRIAIQRRWNQEAIGGWHKHCWPGRPCAEDLELYRKFLLRVTPQNILILGTTPELRDMAQAITNFPITLVDLSLVMFKETSRFLAKIGVNKERWYFANWLTLPFAAATYDLVLGDLIIKQVVPEKRGILFREIHRVLKPQGVFITRNYFRNPRWDGVSLADIVTGLDGLNVCVEELKQILMYRLYDRWIDAKTEIFLPSSLKADEKTLRSYPQIFHRFIRLDVAEWLRSLILKVQRGQERANVNLLQRWAPTKEAFWTNARPFFELVDSCHGTRGEDHKFSPVDLLQKKHDSLS